MKWLSTVLMVAVAVVSAQDPTKVSPEVYKVLEENDDVRVVDMQLEAGKSDKKPGLVKYALCNGSSISCSVLSGLR